jgi:hypothetical protein
MGHCSKYVNIYINREPESTRMKNNTLLSLLCLSSTNANNNAGVCCTFYSSFGPLSATRTDRIMLCGEIDRCFWRFQSIIFLVIDDRFPDISKLHNFTRNFPKLINNSFSFFPSILYVYVWRVYPPKYKNILHHGARVPMCERWSDRRLKRQLAI